MSGPLGNLPGMTYDPLKNRYFPTPKGPLQNDQPAPSLYASTSLPRKGRPEMVLGLLDCQLQRKRQRPDIHESVVSGPGRKLVKGRGRMGVGMGKRSERGEEAILSKLQLDAEHHSCGCHGETITSYKSFGEEAYLATTDHGKLVMHGPEGETVVFYICPQVLMGVHFDIMRLTLIAISGGADPHVHLFKRDPQMLDHIFMSHSELNLSGGDMYEVSSFDDRCTIGGHKSLTTINYTSSFTTSNRRLPSDALAVHQYSRDLVFTGQRSGLVTCEDLRVKPKSPVVVGGTRGRKAVVNVKRVQDGAVPWGLIVSGMGDELLLYDVRFSDKPLHTFQGHINNYQTQVSTALSPSGTHLFASGSDNRIRAYSLLTGSPLTPWPEDEYHQQEENPLVKEFEDKITGLSVRDDLGLDVVVKGQLLRFAK
ncbi:WD repeat-containing protein 21A [Cryptococcus neoformans C23]|uniref:WD repeat-containing protein 21A n=2 Tax=Cryptococcus neoformans TaxID=5207 RepID=A0A854QJP6_CRYNE|nr:WD-repeat protein 21A [Cryptococcus neoformans var. grubii H99]AUB22075.1 WD-repeat protein 21A [Cryptococcus neoformans var. grubii]OWZ36413.1 WD repeat-containing protein 21A [Cryptococcus neoformans var. grubii AD2-60a]OWZ48080.1 WD repeat-containing protein 21A [Cryptococcus neoformans var. grubii C23]OWZ57053.1 WD repeat-containing protein 21A [Cryptococcus neoformans var. grubii AD1-83a]OWZ58344.1 WD repeat-containing protein 21A [Cryptococcus neoformans var. grubii 125.91]OXC87176.1|eukprot:XP_012047056.1 WD-repeat protein 21A [Cryptococcus neoformans var. grubii H99]